MENKPLVTVIAGCYNHAPFVLEALESVRRQTYSNWELIITDDASTDGSQEVIQSWIDTYNIPCTFLKNENNLGPSATFNQAVKLAKGKYLSFMGTDDILFPKKIATQVSQMKKEVGVVYSDCVLINRFGEALSPTTIGKKKPEGNIYPALLKKNFIRPMATLIKKECFEKVGGFDETLPFEDYDMWLRLAKRFAFKFSSKSAGKTRAAPKVKKQVESTFLKIAEKQIQAGAEKKEKSALVDSILKQTSFQLLKSLFRTRSLRFVVFLLFFLLPKQIEKKIFSFFGQA